MSKKIYISPSNQSDNSYATGNTTEMAQCDKIAKAAALSLKRCGFEVKVGKSGEKISNRCIESDRFGADIHLPIHTNAYNGKVTGGTRIFCYDEQSKKPCKAVMKYLGAISPGKGDSISINTGLYEVNTPRAVTVYVECEFHDTKTGSDWIRANTTAIAEAICRGLCDYYGMSYIKEKNDSAQNSNGQIGFRSYLVRIASADGVNIRKGAGTDFGIVGTIANGGAYTVVEEKNGKGAKKWGRLKSGAGWIALDYTEKI